MAWTVTLDFNDGNGARDITNRVLTDSFVRDRSLWTELKPNVNSLRFEMTWDSTIVPLMLNTDNEIDVVVQKDSVDYFTGIVRTNWQLSLTTRPQTLKVECVDKGILLKEKKVKPVTPTLLEGYSVGDTGDTDNSLIHQLLYGAGFTSADVNITTIGDTVDYFPFVESGATYWDVLDRLLFEFHRVFYFDKSGRFCVYDWSPASVTSGDTFDNSNMVGELRIKKVPEKYEAMQVKWYDRDVLTDQIVFSDTTDGNQTHKCSIVLGAGEFYPVGSDSHAVYADYKVEGRDLIAVKDAYVDKIIGDSISENEFTSYFTKAKIEYENKGGDPEYIYKLDIVGDAVVKGDLNVTKRENTSGTTKLLDYEAEYIHTSLAAQRMVRGLGRYYEYADFSYELSSGDSMEPGDFVSIVESNFLNINNQCVVVGRKDNERVGEYFYTLEGISEYSVGDTVSDDGGVSSPFPRQSRDYIVVGASGYAGDADYYCDGDTDETEINAAITFANANNIGTVHLVGGTFSTLAQVVILENVTLDLNNCTISNSTNGASVIYSGADNWKICNGRLSHPGSTSAGTLVTVSGGENIDIYNLTSSDLNNAIVVSVSENVRIYGCRFTNARNAGIAAGGARNSSIYDNTIIGASRGMTISSGTEVRNNYIADCLIDGIYIDTGADDSILSSNKIRNCGINRVATTAYVGLKILSGSDYCLVSGNYITECGNLINYSTCENANPPQIDGNSASNASAARSDVEAYEGTYSYLITKTVASGTRGYYRFTDNGNSDDQHGFIDSGQYRCSLYVYVPSTGGPAAAEVSLRFAQYYSSAWHYTDATATGQDAWELLTLDATVNASATGCAVEISIADTAENTEFIYIDNVRVVPLGLGNDHNTNFSDSGTGTVVSGNSWQ